MVDSGGREQQIVIQGGGWNVLVPEALSLLGSGEYLTTRSVLRTHVHLAADGSQSSRRTTSYLLHPIYTRSINDINVHISITADSYFGRLFVKERTWSFIFPFHGLALYLYSSSTSSSSHLAMDWNVIALYPLITGS